MKRTAAFFVVLLILFSAIPSGAALGARAEGFSYARVVSDNAVFYSDAALAITRFYLPKSYFVKIVSIGVESSRVIYMESNDHPAAEGYVKNADLYFTSQTPTEPYPALTLTVAVDEVMFADVSRTQPKCVLSKNSLEYYYGEIVSAGETYLYVYSLGNVGYVKKSSFQDYSLPLHPTFVEQTEQTSAPDTSKSDSSNTPSPVGSVTTAQVIIIALLIVGVLCMLFLLLRPEQKYKNKDAYYDDE
ncbi:MAG: hypothetical protein J6Y44_03215 [Clostridia bacterium]|nr:hypothetical protein [Clostridia bacterium]